MHGNELLCLKKYLLCKFALTFTVDSSEQSIRHKGFLEHCDSSDKEEDGYCVNFYNLISFSDFVFKKVFIQKSKSLLYENENFSRYLHTYECGKSSFFISDYDSKIKSL